MTEQIPAEDRRLEDAIKSLGAASERISAAIAPVADQKEFELAVEAEDAAYVEYERALLARGWPPIWPPRTPEGHARLGVTEQQVAEWARTGRLR